jgi:hypothetical protein
MPECWRGLSLANHTQVRASVQSLGVLFSTEITVLEPKWRETIGILRKELYKLYDSN